MKFLLSFFLLLFVTACQTTSNTDVEEKQTSTDQIAEVEPDEEGLSHLLPSKDSELADKDSDAPGTYDNIWLKLAEGFEFEVPENDRIKKQRDYFLSHPKHLAQVSKRAEPFLHLIVEQIEARDLPLELALLPVVESTFDPFAYSHSHASGIWQFMPVTGDRFGLKQDWWYDGRRDIYASTDAALKYMQILHDYLGDDWLYAFAAYNSGEGRVQRAVKANRDNNKPTDYWNLNLPRETQEYVPKLLALVDIIRNHEKYNIELPYIANEQVLTYVDTHSQIDLAYAAELAELSIAEMQLLNPAFNHWATPPNGPHKLLVPTKIADQFSEKLAKTDPSKRISWDRYIVRSGDSLSVIAQKNSTTTKVIQEINELDNSFIRIGQPLLIPVASQGQQQYLYSQSQRFESKQVAKKAGLTKGSYTVVEGDTLWDISRRYDVTSQEIAKWNNMNTRQTLRLGQKLTIWKKPSATAATKTGKAKSTHTIVAGDTLWDISRQYNVNSQDIAKWNNMNSSQTLRLGQKLTIWKPAAAADNANTTRRVTYSVRSGDSLGLIAQKFNVKTSDIVRWNELNKSKYIQPGQKLQVYVAVQNPSN